MFKPFLSLPNSDPTKIPDLGVGGNRARLGWQSWKETWNFNQEFIKFWYILCNNLLITSNNHFYQCRQSLTCESWTGSLLFYIFITFFHKFKCYLLVQYDVLPEWIFGIQNLSRFPFAQFFVSQCRSEWIFGPHLSVVESVGFVFENIL